MEITAAILNSDYVTTPGGDEKLPRRRIPKTRRSAAAGPSLNKDVRIRLGLSRYSLRPCRNIRRTSNSTLPKSPMPRSHIAIRVVQDVIGIA